LWAGMFVVALGLLFAFARAYARPITAAGYPLIAFTPNTPEQLPPETGNAADSPTGKTVIRPAGRGSLLTIPVVVHVIHDPATGGDAAPYPDDASIYAGIDWINNLLAGGPACAGDPASVETGIRLCPATRDISGRATSAI